MRKLLTSTTLSLSLLAAPSYALDDQSAADLARNLSRYVGQAAFDTGIVKVAADGDAYRIDVDLDTLASLVFPKDVLKFEIAPHSMRVRPLADGTWQVGSGLFPNGSLEMIQQQKQRFDWTIAEGKESGVFDTALATFSSYSASFAEARFVARENSSHSETIYGPTTVNATATKSPNGGVDYSQTQSVRGYSNSQTVKEGTQSFPIETKASAAYMDAKGSGLRSRAILDLLAFGVANPTRDKMAASQAEGKLLLKAALPLWERIDVAQALTDLSVTTPVGLLRAGNLGLSVSLDGVRQDGELEIGTRIEHLEIGSLFLPAWTRPLMPSEVDLNVGITNLDLESAAIKAIDSLDLGRDPPIPPAISDQITAEYRAHPPIVTLSKSMIRNQDIQITAEAELTFPPQGVALESTIEATGYEKVAATLDEAAKGNAELAGMASVTAYIKAIGKQLPDGRLQWVVRANPDGSVFVNSEKVRSSTLSPL